MAVNNVKELKYLSTEVLVEFAKKALQAKADASGNVITTTYATKTEIADVIHMKVVTALPTTGDPYTMYLVTKSPAVEAPNKYSMYIWVSGDNIWQKIGGDIDLSGKLDKLTTTGLHVYTHNGTTQGELGIDTAPTDNSNNLVTSGSVKAELDKKYVKPEGGITAADLADEYYLASNPDGFIDKTVSDLENYTPTGEFGDLAFEDSLASTNLTDSADLIRKTDVINNTSSTETQKPLSANAGHELQEQIDNLKAIGRYLSGWDATTGLPTTNPPSSPYTYQTGDYFIVRKVATGTGTNYKPNGTTYVSGIASTTIETQVVKVNDYYRFDGTTWQLEINTQRTTTFASIEGRPEDNANLKNALDAKADDVDIHYTNENGTTVAVGGIAKGTTFDDMLLKDIIENMLYPYVAFTFSSIATNPSATTYEYGAAKTVTKVTPTFTKGSKNITSVKIGTTSGGSDLYSGTSATTGTAITLATPASFDGLANKTIYCTLSDGQTTTTKSATFTFSKYYYYTVTNSTTIPTTATSNGTSAEKDGIATTENTYIWWLSPTAKTKIQQYAMNQWNDMTTTYAGTTTFTTATGQSLTYYAYRTDKMVSATGRYRIA